VKINIGCGITPTEGWANLDNSLSVRLVRCLGAARTLRSLRLLNESSYRLAAVAYSRNIRFANAVPRIPCPDGSAGAVYSLHMIEHLDRREARAFLEEVRRVPMLPGTTNIADPGRLDLRERASESVYVEAFEPDDPRNDHVRPRCAV
jgi:predicted SAM-dependent methyltransferase